MINYSSCVDITRAIKRQGAFLANYKTVSQSEVELLTWTESNWYERHHDHLSVCVCIHTHKHTSELSVCVTRIFCPKSELFLLSSG